MSTPSRSALVALGMFLAFATPALTLLMHRTDDVYVRQSDLIIVGDVASLGTHNDVPVAEVHPVEVVMGSLPTFFIHVRNFPEGAEDMPYFREGERSLLFLVEDVPEPGIFWCVGADATKRDRSSYGVEGWASMLDRVAQLVSARSEPDDQTRMAVLVRLLESEDLHLVAAASNYMNYLQTGEEDEGWVIHPPEDSSDWSWRDYFNRNALAHKKLWQEWWQDQEATP